MTQLPEYNRINETNEINEISETNPELKNKENHELKKLLMTLGIAVIAAHFGTRAVGFLFSVFFAFYPPYSTGSLFNIEVFSEIISTGSITVMTRDFYYLFIWLVSDIIVYLPPFIVFTMAFGKYMKQPHQFKTYEFKWGWVFLFFAGGYSLSIAASIFSHYIADIISDIFGTGGLRDVFADMMPNNNTQAIMMFVVVAIIAPVCEEYLYRHLLLKPLRRFGDVQAVIITAVLFGFFHGNFTQFLYATCGGILLGIIAVRSNSVKPAIAMHALNNGYDVVRSRVYTLAEEGTLPFDAESVGLFSILFMLIGAVAFIYIATMGYLKISNENPHMTSRERANAVIKNPAVIIMLIVLLVVTVQGTV